MFRSQRGLSSAAVESARRKAPQIHLTSVHGYIGLSTVVAWALEALTRCAVAAQNRRIADNQANPELCEQQFEFFTPQQPEAIDFFLAMHHYAAPALAV
jgi:hypothetical protein